MIPKYLFGLLVVLSSIGLNAQIVEDAASAFKQAKKNNQSVLLVFSGSDWCRPCIKFKKEVLNDSTFIDFSKSRLVVLNADFPQRKNQSEALVKQNEQLAEQYNPNGFFPQVVLLNSDSSIVANIAYTRQSASEFISQIETLLPKVILKEFKKRVPSMGSFFEFIVVDSVQNEQRAWEIIEQCKVEVNRIEQLISEWIETSEVSRINSYAGVKPVQVSSELYQLIARSIQIGELTQGAFDITFHALDGLWKFDGTQKRPVDSILINNALRKVGYQQIQLLDSNFVYLPIKGMSIGFGGIGQGYAVDKVNNLMQKKNQQNYVINSSGDVFASGLGADGSTWKVGVANPYDKTEIIRWLEVDDKAVVTSGNYEKYFEFEGKRYAHIINPKTGWPTQDIVSVTVINPYTEIADALATSIFVLGVEVGIDLVNQLPETHCIIIDDKKNVYISKDLMVD